MKYIPIYLIDIIVCILSIYFYFTAFTHFSDNHLLIIIATIFCYFSAVGIMKDVKDCYNLYKNNKPSK